MKPLYRFIAFLISLALFSSGCEEDEGTAVQPEFDAPAISVISPDLSAGELTPTVGETVSFVLSFSADAGLSQVFVNETSIKKYDGSETQGELTYAFLVQKEEAKEFVFTIEDAYGTTTATSPVTVNPVPGVDLGYLLIDFAGRSSATEDKTVVDWDIRKMTTFNVSGSLTAIATAEVANSQAQLSFAQPNPVEGEMAKVHKIVKVPAEGFDNWGGWVHIMYGLKKPIPVGQINALPQWNAETNQLTQGTRVIKIDAYYDATVDPDFAWDDLLGLTEIWNADPSQGYKVDLVLANYEKHANAESGYDAAGYYISYAAYIPEPNKWVTLTFNMVDEGRMGNFFASGSETAATASEIDCIDIKPAAGYNGEDENPLYFKNLRIVEVE